jgi:hypothetical protein
LRQNLKSILQNMSLLMQPMKGSLDDFLKVASKILSGVTPWDLNPDLKGTSQQARACSTAQCPRWSFS